MGKTGRWADSTHTQTQGRHKKTEIKRRDTERLRETERQRAERHRETQRQRETERDRERRGSWRERETRNSIFETPLLVLRADLHQSRCANVAESPLPLQISAMFVNVSMVVWS